MDCVQAYMPNGLGRPLFSISLRFDVSASRPLALRFYQTDRYPCSYLSDRQARSQVMSPGGLMTPLIYSELVRQGFRRSGNHIYRPDCDTCQACTPVRVAVTEFSPSRSQRRAWKQHESLAVTMQPLRDDDEIFALYRRYQSARHAGGGMDNDSREQFRNALLSSPVESLQAEFRDSAGRLQMVSVIDVLQDGLSAVYTFYDPAPGASLGSYNVLWQLALCRQLELPYLYLGYYIADSQKMAYKSRFRPLQGYRDGVWTPLSLVADRRRDD